MDEHVIDNIFGEYLSNTTRENFIMAINDKYNALKNMAVIFDELKEGKNIDCGK